MKKNLHIFIIAIIFAFIYGICFDSKLDINGDNASYIKLAENISNSLGYSNVGVNGIEPASHFPPGYSAILSVFMFLGIHSLIFFKILNGLFLLTSLILLYYVTSKMMKNKVLALVIAILTIFSPKLINFANMAMSEMSYLFCITVAIFALSKYADKEKTAFLRSPYFYIAIVAAAASYYIRTVGMSIIFALLVFYAFRREWKQMLVSAGGIILLLMPWAIRNSLYGIESRYFGTIMTVNAWRPEQGSISTVGEMVQKMITNFDETVIKGFNELLFPFVSFVYKEPSSIILWLIGLLVLAIVLWGAWNMKKLRYLFLAFFAANIGLFMLWHGGNECRYVVPITPIIFICFWSGVYCLLGKIKLHKQNSESKIPYLFLIMLVPMMSPIYDYRQISKTPYLPQFKNYFKVAKAIQEKPILNNKVICCRKPELLSYYAKNVYAVNYSFTLNKEELIRDLIKKQVDYVVLDNLGYSSTIYYLYPAITEYPYFFTSILKLENPDTYLFEFDRAKAIVKFGEE